jgi:hypothetical protein
MNKTLDTKLAMLANDPAADCFILADAKDPDMARGVASAGKNADGSLRSINDLRDQIREIVAQGLVDIMLMSASTSEILTIEERIFDASAVTPAARANDTTDLHLARGSCYAAAPSRPFMSTTIDHIQAGKSPCNHTERSRGANLGLYSVTFNNIPERDLESLEAYKAFRLEAEAKGFRHFLEVFPPNVPANVHGLSPEIIPAFMNDHIVRMLAGVPKTSRPCFLKMPYLGPRAVEELCAYDPSIIVGVLGGSAGTTHDAFHLVADSRKHGARVALFGRKIVAAEHQLSFVAHLRLVADNQLTAREAVKSYHAALRKLGIAPHRSLEDDLSMTETVVAYGGTTK